jgi:S-formylglutathione hydrolase FrmB
MALCDVHRYSDVLKKHVGLYVILPEVGTAPFPTLYLLHGLSDDYTNWLRRTRLEYYARSEAMIIVMPDGYRGFYTNAENGVPYARYIAEETVGFIDKTFPSKKSRQARFVGGLSMGGYGALRLALGYPAVFGSASSHSGALMHGTRRPQETALWEYDQVFGANPMGSDHDLLKLAESARASGTLPRIRFDCGISDPLLRDNRDFHGALTELHVPHEYEEFAGGHDWDYWDLHVRDALRFHTESQSNSSRQ